MKRSAALIELILTILVFAFAAMLLLRVTAFAGSLSKNSSDELKATLEMQSIVEQLRADSDELSLICEKDGFTAYYDTAFLPCSEGEAKNYIDITVEPKNTSAGCLYELTLLASAEDRRTVADLSAAVYVPKAGGSSNER